MDLRPKTFKDFTGQEDSKIKMQIAIAAAKKTGKPLGHVLISGPAGTGKTTFAEIIAHELGVYIISTIGNNIRTDRDVFNLIKRVSRAEMINILFVDEVHTISPTGQNNLLTTMEDSMITVKSGHNSQRYEFPPIIVIGATTNPGKLLKPLYDRFDHKLVFTPYTITELTETVKFTVSRLEVINTITDKAAKDIAARCRGIPRIGTKFVKMAESVAVTWKDRHGREKKTLDMDVVKETFEKVLHVDKNGLNDLTDIKILKYLFNMYPQSVGISNMCQMIDEDSDHVATIIEPQLFKLGFIERSRSGRIITKRGMDYLKENNHLNKEDMDACMIAVD